MGGWVGGWVGGGLEAGRVRVAIFCGTDPVRSAIHCGMRQKYCFDNHGSVAA